ncbi:Gep3p NDAI_0E01580 [Naumovozyma dairenensis CBS 421]|uniref:Genetic interactor of prohibitins 3, mitochondrial n=1 Tax=Naumovozyma dairenensis (strain ATCC 10597 / BCRC 20456 / CBS 421 / NBRC 0211 / NRRL Y-12639) TaxID=1071378 RepID=G0WB54_NAUDC|nr:hypothetical protein NDAI_0E01580 [Naumovozyma dairenensis CBS 421]CCD24974.1 hypothetical protein NDAI_0E01580 [Naumovozyma dairenensis CBS 421]
MFPTLCFRNHSRKFSTSLTRWINCNSCGIELQKKDPCQVGYYQEPKTAKRPHIKSIEDLKYLLFSQDIQKLKEDEKEVIESKGANNSHLPHNPLFCKRCVDALHQNKYEMKDFQRMSFFDVVENIPRESNVLHCVPFPEFPFHLDKGILSNKHYTTSLLLTKSDQLIRHKSTLNKDVQHFLKDFTHHYMSVKTNKAIAVSALKNWNMDVLYTNLKKNSYFLGATNAGKSTLINSLLRKYLGYKVNIDKKGNIIHPEFPPDLQKNIKKFQKLQSAGVSYIPNMTRKAQPYQIGDKLIFDLPGYTANVNEVLLEDIIEKDWLELIRKTELFTDRYVKSQSYKSIKGSKNGACYTLGGIFFIVPPEGTINQIVKYIPGKPSTFRNVSKALEVFSNVHSGNGTETKHPWEQYCGITQDFCDINKFERHVLPPFQGSIEIVLKDIGYILLRTTGTYEFKGLHELWVPKGIEVCIRKPLLQLIKNNYSTNDSKVSYLSSRNDPIVSKTYVMDHDEKDTLLKMQEIFKSSSEKGKVSRKYIHEDPKILLNSENPKCLFWYFDF